MCGFNKMVPQRTLQTSQWPQSETCFPGNSFPVSETCRCPHALPIFQRVIFFLWGIWGIWNLVVTLTNPVRWMIWRKSSVRKFVRSIVSCWSVSWPILKEKGLKTASNQTVGILPISFLKLNRLVWHVLSFNICINKCEFTWKQLSTVCFKDVRLPWITLYLQKINQIGFRHN